jgi:hypothetical protein
VSNAILKAVSLLAEVDPKRSVLSTILDADLELISVKNIMASRKEEP